MTKLLELKNISHYSKENIRVKDINLTIHEGEKIALIGKSGSGKSTLISIANGSLTPNEGDVRWKGTQIKNIIMQLQSIYRCRNKFIRSNNGAS